MNKRVILLVLVYATAIILSLNFVSAASYSSYSDWYNNYWKNLWKNEFELNQGNQNNYNTNSEAGDYSPHLNYNSNDRMDYNRELNELRTESESIVKDAWNYERTATTVVVTTETETEERTPQYNYMNYYRNYDGNYDSNHNRDYPVNYNQGNYQGYSNYNDWRNQMYDNYYNNYNNGFNNGKKTNNVNCNNCNGVPCTNWRYKQCYGCDKENYDYYPEYDSCLGYYNWRW